jgi:hypothetical protein
MSTRFLILHFCVGHRAPRLAPAKVSGPPLAQHLHAALPHHCTVRNLGGSASGPNVRPAASEAADRALQHFPATAIRSLALHVCVPVCLWIRRSRYCTVPSALGCNHSFLCASPPPGWAAMPRVASVGGRGRPEGGWRSSSRSRSCFKLRAADAAARLSPLKRTLSHLYTTNHTLNAPPQQTKRDRPAPARQGKMQNPTKERYFDPQALLADDTVRPGPPAHGVVDLAPACPHPEPPAPPFPVQLVPTTFRFSVKTLGKALDPTCTSTDVSAGGCGALRAGGTAGARRSGCTAHAPHAAPAAPTSPLTAPLPPHCTCSCRRTTSSTCRCGW